MTSRIAAAFRRLGKAPLDILALLFDPQRSRSYWPEERRKRRSRVFADLLWWLIRYGEVNGYYYVYGLDRAGIDRRKDLLPYRAFRRIRNRANLRTNEARWNYVCVLRDKLLFATVACGLGIPTPRPYALLDSDTLMWLHRGPHRKLPLECLCEHSDEVLDGFCKKLTGIQGEGAFALRVDHGRLLIAGTEVPLAAVRARMNGQYLFQERIEQHPAMSALHAASLNTLRLITFCTNGHASLFSAALRVGTHGNNVDNWASGGLIVAVDAGRGALRGEGYFKPGYGGRTDVHPDSRIRLPGFEIPYFPEAVALVLYLHEHLRGVHSIGWDVGITSTGPTIIEGNDDWEGGIPMVLEPAFRRRFLRMYPPDAHNGMRSMQPSGRAFLQPR